MLQTEKGYIEAAKRNDVETMKLLGRGVNVNAKNVVGQHFMNRKSGVFTISEFINAVRQRVS